MAISRVQNKPLVGMQLRKLFEWGKRGSQSKEFNGLVGDSVTRTICVQPVPEPHSLNSDP